MSEPAASDPAAEAEVDAAGDLPAVGGKAAANDPAGPDPVVGPSKPRLFGILGPGLIAGASDDDPSGIATYSQAGAAFGYGLSWTLLFSYPLMVAVQMVGARIGRTTGHGIAGVLRRHYPGWLLQWIVVLLLIANVVNLGADLGAMADAAALVVPGPKWLYLLFFVSLCVGMQLMLQYTRYVAVLKWFTLSLFAYFAVLGVAHVDWGRLTFHLLVPQLHMTPAMLTCVVAVFGTTISPYLFFWQSEQEVEDLRAHPRRRSLLDAPSQGPAALHRIEIDTLAGMGLSNLVALAIMATAAATLHANGVTDISTSAQAAEALRPIAGGFASVLFAAGVVGTGLLSVPVLAGSAAYAIGEARNWPVGFTRRVQEAKAFYATIAIATLVGMVINFTSIQPISALFWSAVLNGVIAVPVMAVIMRASSRTDIMGAFAVRGWLRAFGWLATGVMFVIAVAMLASVG